MMGVPPKGADSSFFVQTRLFQQRLLKVALEATSNDIEYAATILGLTELEFVDIASILAFELPEKERSKERAEKRELSDEEKAELERLREERKEQQRQAFREQKKQEEMVEAVKEAEEKEKQELAVEEGLSPKDDEEGTIIAAFNDAPDLMTRQQVETALGLSKEAVLRLKVQGKLEADFDKETKVFVFHKKRVVFYALERHRSRLAKQSES